MDYKLPNLNTQAMIKIVAKKEINFELYLAATLFIMI